MAGANPGSAGFVTDILVGSSAWLGPSLDPYFSSVNYAAYNECRPEGESQSDFPPEFNWARVSVDLLTFFADGASMNRVQREQ